MQSHLSLFTLQHFCQLSPLGNTYCMSTDGCFLGAVIVVSLVKGDLILLLHGLVLPLLEREYCLIFATASTQFLSNWILKSP